jgi:hypothetical protein
MFQSFGRLPYFSHGLLPSDALPNFLKSYKTVRFSVDGWVQGRTYIFEVDGGSFSIDDRISIGSERVRNQLPSIEIISINV